MWKCCLRDGFNFSSFFDELCVIYFLLREFKMNSGWFELSSLFFKKHICCNILFQNQSIHVSDPPKYLHLSRNFTYLCRDWWGKARATCILVIYHHGFRDVVKQRFIKHARSNYDNLVTKAAFAYDSNTRFLPALKPNEGGNPSLHQRRYRHYPMYPTIEHGSLRWSSTHCIFLANC